MNKVITGLEARLQIEKARLVGRDLWRNQMETFGSATIELPPVDEELIAQLEEAIKILKESVAP